MISLIIPVVPQFQFIALAVDIKDGVAQVTKCVPRYS